MASRVNTKFVVILIVAVIAMLGMLFAAYSVVYKTADDLADRGDKALAAGDVTQACLLYSKSVNKDPTIIENIEKWIAALEMWIPETETAYYDAFRKNYMGAINRAAVVQRTNVEAYRRELDLQTGMLLNRYSRSHADSIISRTTEVLGNFDGLNGVDPLWPSLRRYRGIAWERIAANNGVVDSQQHMIVLEDLDAALQVAPDDDYARTARMRWMVFEAKETIVNDDISGVTKAREDAVKMARAHLAQYPASPLTAVSLIAIEMELARAVASEGLVDSARTQSIRESLYLFKDQVHSLYEDLLHIPPSKMSISMIHNFQLVEQLADPENNLSLTKAIMSKMIEADPDSSRLLLTSATLMSSTGDQSGAAELYRQIIDLPVIPISTKGVSLFGAQRESLISLSSIMIDEFEILRASVESSQERKDELLNQAIEARDLYASRVTEDNTSLMLINGRIAFAQNQTEEALRLFKVYNNQTQNRSSDGLWLEALAARKLNQLGTAHTALVNLLGVQKFSIRALITLADIEVRLQDLRSAKLRYEKVLIYDPPNRIAREGIANINALQDPSLIDDPAIALVLTARQLRRGTEENPGDISAAITVLAEGIESVNYESSVSRELVVLLMDRGDLVGARSVLDRAVVANPDIQGLREMREALEYDDEVDILIALTKISQPDKLEQLISIANIVFSRQRLDILDSTLIELLAMAPNDSRVVDLAFVRALEKKDLDAAKAFAQRATDNNIDRVNGLSYQARIASFQGDHERAIQLFEQASSSGAADSSLFRMIAIEQRIVGRIESAINSFERALSVRPDDQASILEYINTLAMVGRYEDALDTTRRFQRHAIDNPQFMSMWLLLEAGYGGTEGQEFAVRQREKFLELNPDDQTNKFALASLYISDTRWDEARILIDELRSTDDSLRNAELEARWFANQGRIGNLNGLASARQVYLDYIETHGDKIDSSPYIALSRFMLERGRPDLAVQSASSAVERENPETLEGTKLLGDLFMMLNQYTNAAESFRKVVDSGSDTDDQYRLRLIDMLIRTRQFDQAKEQFGQLSKLNQETKIALLQSSEIEEGVGNLDKAADLLDRAVASFSDDPLVYIKRAEFLAGSEENMTDMLADVDAALRINPNDWRAYRIRAAAYFAIDQRSDALRDLQKAVRLNPKLDQALFGIINEMMIDGRNSEAYDFANEIVEQRRYDASLMNSLGQLFSSRDDWDHASKLYESVWDVQRSPTAGATLIDAILRTRNPDTKLANSVINDLTEVAGDIERSPGLLAAQALVLQARGRDQLAIQQLTKAFDLSTNDDSQLIQWSGNISRYFEGQSMQDQINYLETLKRRNPNQEVLNWLDLFVAQRLIRVGSQEEAAYEIFDRLVNVENQATVQRISYQSYGTTMYASGEYSRAIEIWAAGSELYPDDWEMSNNLAYVLSTESGEHERAMELAQRAVEVNPNRSEPYDTLGRIYIALGKYDEASQVFNTGMKYAMSVRSRVTLVLGQVDLDFARGEIVEARSKLIDIRSLMRAMPTRDVGLEEQVDEIESKIDSAG